MARKRKGPRLRAQIGALPLLAGILIASGLLRLGDGTGQAIAREVGQIAGSTARAAPPDQPADPDLAPLVAALDARTERLDQREETLDARAAELAATEERLRAQLETLQAAKAELDGLLGIADEAAEADLGRLTAVYESMKPKDAAALFAEMEPQFAAGFLGRMRADAAAEIMAGLPPEIAYSMSVLLAGRNANLPRNR